MRDYVRLTDGKARKKAYKDKVRAAKLAAGGPAHSLSPSSSSSFQSSMGETVPASEPLSIPVKNLEQADVNVDSKFVVNIPIGEGINLVSKDNVACTPSDNPPAVGESGSLGQDPVVSCGNLSIASLGTLDLAPLTVAGEVPTHTSQPPQGLATPNLGMKTPSTVRSRVSSISKLTPGAFNTLKAVLDLHEGASRDEKMKLMYKSLMDSDSSFKGSLSRSRSCRSERSVATQESRKSRGEGGKSADFSRKSSLTRDKLEVTPIVGCSSQTPNRMELTQEWARMVQTGGVTVKAGTSYFFKDKLGNDQYVIPPTDSRPGGGALRQTLGSMAFSAAAESSPSGDVASGRAKKKSLSQGSGGGGKKGEVSPQPSSVSLSPAPHVSPRERPVSPHRPLKRTHEGEGKSPVSPGRRQGKETPLSPVESPHQAGVSPQMGEGGAPDLGERSSSTSRVSPLIPKSPARRKRWLSDSFSFAKPQGKVFRAAGGERTRGLVERESQGERKTSTSVGTQWDLRDAIRAGSFLIERSETRSQATQIEFDLLKACETGSQTIEPYSAEFGAQAFEEEPFEGLLSRQEVCDLINVDRFIGLGMKDQPEAEYHNHTLISKRCMNLGVVYQIIIIKEQYMPSVTKVDKASKATATMVEVERTSNEEERVIDLTDTQEEDKSEEIEIVQVVEKKSVSKEEKPKKIKEEKPKVDIKMEEEILTFKEKPWVNLRNKIVGMQRNQAPTEIPDDRTPYQRRTEAPAEPGPCLLEINDHIRRAMEEVDEFLRNKPRETQAFLPLALGKRIVEQYNSFLKPNFDLDPELGTRLEGLLSGVAFSGLGKKSAPISSSELGKLAQSTFNILEIISFIMSSIAVMDEGLAKAEAKSKGIVLGTLQEYRPFLASTDKACRHMVRETLALMATCMIKQKSILGSSFAAGVPVLFKNRFLRSPLAVFNVTPPEILDAIKEQYEKFIQQRAFTTAITRLGNVGMNKFKSSRKIVKSKITMLNRGGAGRGQNFRGSGTTRGARGMNRGTLRGVNKSSFNISKNTRGYMRRDRAIRGMESHPRGRANTSGAGFSGENRP